MCTASQAAQAGNPQRWSRPNSRHARRRADRGERALVDVTERQRGPAVERAPDAAGGVPAHLHGGRGHAGDGHAVPLEGREVADDEHLGMRRAG